MLTSCDGFMHSPEPFYDICFIRTQNREIESCIENTSSRIGLKYSKSGDFIFVGSCELKRQMLSGYGKIDKEMFWGNDEINVKNHDAIYGIGNYTYFNYHKHVVFCCPDYLGLGSLYIYRDSVLFLVSNRPHLAAIFASLSPDKKINESCVKAHILGTTTWFRRNLLIDKTPIENLECVPAEKFILIKKDRLLLFDRKTPELNLTYDEALSQAAKEIHDDFNILQEKLSDKVFVWDLSGGKDTRMTISPFINRELEINTAYSDRMLDDLTVSHQILSIFPNLKYCEHYYADAHFIDQETSLEAWRSLLFGQAHDMSLAWTATGGKSKKICVSGGAGEVYRTSFIYLKPKPKCTIKEWLLYILGLESYLNRLDEVERDEIKKFILNELLPKLELIKEENDAMSYLYYNSSMRGHFGNRLHSVYCNSMVIYPALNFKLYLESRKLSVEQRNDGIIVYDFVKMQDEILASIDYSKDYAYQNQRRRFVAKPLPERLAVSQKSYYASLKKVEQDFNETVRGQDLPKWMPEDAFLNIKVCEAISRIILIAPQLENFMRVMYGLYNSIQNQGGKRAVASKIFTIDDYICPLKSEKEKYVSSRIVEDMINPICGYEIKNGNIQIRTFDYIKEKNFYFAVYLRKNRAIQKQYPYKLGTMFPYDGTEFDVIQLFAKNKSSKLKNVITCVVK